jgi:hypothetical protein
MQMRLQAERALMGTMPSCPCDAKYLQSATTAVLASLAAVACTYWCREWCSVNSFCSVFKETIHHPFGVKAIVTVVGWRYVLFKQAAFHPVVRFALRLFQHEIYLWKELLSVSIA